MDWSSCLVDGAPSISCLEPLFANIVNAVTLLAGIALFAMLTVGGYKYLTSGGDPKKTEEAKGVLTYSFIGLMIIIGAYLIIRVIATFFGDPIGSSLLKFKITFPDVWKLNAE